MRSAWREGEASEGENRKESIESNTMEMSSGGEKRKGGRAISISLFTLHGVSGGEERGETKSTKHRKEGAITVQTMAGLRVRTLHLAASVFSILFCCG